MVGKRERKGMRLLTLSSIPAFSERPGSTVGKMSIEPSAPPPLKVVSISDGALDGADSESTYALGPLLREIATASSTVF